MGDGSGTALWFGASEFEVLPVFDDGVELTVEVQTVAAPHPAHRATTLRETQPVTGIRPRRPRSVA